MNITISVDVSDSVHVDVRISFVVNAMSIVSVSRKVNVKVNVHANVSVNNKICETICTGVDFENVSPQLVSDKSST